MQAVILAGGRGTRLYPLTSNMPKPMLNLFNKPVLEHTIELLKHYDIRDIVITLAYKAEQIIDYFGSGSRWGVNIQYYLEDTPKGSAGGLRRIQPVLNETFVVVSGDAGTDFDLKAALDFHKKKSAIATLLLYEAKDPSLFGIVDSSEDGLIKRFIEKPKPSEAFTNTINSGIYILEPEVLSYIPYEVPYDFSKDVFPLLLQNQEPFYSYRTEGYWCDIGSLAQYRNVHFDALTGKFKLNLSATRIANGIWIGADSDIHSSVKLRTPIYIGNGVKIGENSTLGRFTVIGDTSFVDKNSCVTQSILGTGTSIGKSTNVFGSVLGTGFKLPDGNHLADEVLINDDSMSVIRGEIEQELLSQRISEEHAFTWSGLEMTQLVDEVSSMQPLAA